MNLNSRHPLDPQSRAAIGFDRKSPSASPRPLARFLARHAVVSLALVAVLFHVFFILFCWIFTHHSS
jgi:hypothetical protein